MSRRKGKVRYHLDPRNVEDLPEWVKKPERLEALAYVMLIAALVRAIIQRRVRRYA